MMNSKTTLATLLFLLLLFYANGQSQELNYPIAKGQKVIGTFSGELDEKRSFHLLTYQNKSSKLYTAVPFFINENDQITQLAELEFEKRPQVISFHHQADPDRVVLLIGQQISKKSEQLRIFDLDIANGTYANRLIEDRGKEDLKIRLADRTIFAHNKKDKLQLIALESSKEIDTVQVQVSATKAFKKFFEFFPQVVNTREYVELGSTRDGKAYFQNDRIIFDINVDDVYKTFLIDPRDSIMNFKEIEHPDFKSAKETNSFVYDQQLFVFVHLGEDIGLLVYDLKTGTLKFEGSLKKNFAEGLDEARMLNLIKKSARGRYRLMGTVNTSVEDHMVVRLDYVDMNTYNYHYDWWFHHWFFHDQMWQQQQMMQNLAVPNFGPNPPENMLIDVVVPAAEKETEIEFVLSNSFELLPLASKSTRYRQTDKDFYINAYKNNPNVDHTTMSFTQSSVRYIFYSKLGKLFYIKSQPLKK